MRFNFLTSVALIAVVVGLALAWRTKTIEFQSGEAETIKVVIRQLAAEDGVIPVEIMQPMVSSSAPNKLEDFSYIIRNNSAKPISAVAVMKTITYEEGGSYYTHSVYSMMDSAFHPDMANTRSLLPGTQTSMESAGPTSFNKGAVIREITLTVDYVSYYDNTAYGSGREGERRINAMRDGARQYKSWLKQKYSRAGKSLATILPLMQAPGVSQELKLSLDQTLGADRYRIYLLKTLQTKGAPDAEKLLQQNP